MLAIQIGPLLRQMTGWLLAQEIDLAVEEEFANQLVSLVKSLPFGDIYQEATASLAPVSLMHQENSQRALKVG